MENNKYVIEILEGQKLTAGSKAKEDIVRFLTESEFSKITFIAPKNKLSRVIMGGLYWKRTLKNIEEGSTIIYQYPAYSRIMGDYFIKEADHKKVKKIMLIHDLDSFRQYKNKPKDIERELKFCNEFDGIVCHNDVMKKWLVENGCTTKIVSLEIFDYYEDLPIKDTRDEQSLIFAGNLSKADFISSLECETSVNLYGINPKENYKENIIYQGAFDPSELGKYLTGKYGLVWDGDSINSCTGMTGEYMRVNNPHKTSLYLTLGIPVIIWEKAALAQFIKENKLGIAVPDLEHIDEYLAQVTEDEYLVFKKNSIKMSQKLRTGFYIKKAIEELVKG